MQSISGLKVNAHKETALKAIIGFFLLFSSSQISIPIEPVPINLGTIGVMSLGLLFDRRTALISTTSFLFLGAIGFPVFANFGFGFPVLLGPRGGYLIGYLLAVYIMTSLKKYLKESLLNYFIINIAGTLSVFILGIGWLSYLFGIEKALAVGFFPFILSGFIKIILLSLGIYYIKPQIFKKNVN